MPQTYQMTRLVDPTKGVSFYTTLTGYRVSGEEGKKDQILQKRVISSEVLFLVSYDD